MMARGISFASTTLLVALCILPNVVFATQKLKRTYVKKQSAVQPVVIAPRILPIRTWRDRITGSFDITSNYIFRGISQTNNHPAAQGGLTYTFDEGFYINTWGSNVEFTAPNGTQASGELDLSAGWQSKLGQPFTCNIHLDRYNYPGARYANYNELNALFSYNFLQVSFGYTSNYSGTHARGLYSNIAATYALPTVPAFYLEDFNVQADIGHYALARAAGSSYNNYGVSLNKKINAIYTFTLGATGTNGRAKQPPLDHGHVFGMMTAYF